MGKFDNVGVNVGEVPAEKVRTAYAQTTQANAWVPFAQAMLTWIALPFVVFVASTVTAVTSRITWEDWLYLNAAALCAFAGFVWWTYPKRLRIADDTLHNREMAEKRDMNGDGLIGAHPVYVTRKDERSTPEKRKAFERDRFISFVRAAYKDPTVRGLRAMGWKDELLNSTYKDWLFSIVRMPDGQPAAQAFGKGQWRIAYPLEEVLAVIDTLEWAGAESKTPVRW